MNWLKSLLGLGEAAAGYFEKKAELKQKVKLAKLEGQIKIEQAKADLAVKKLDTDHEWELAQIQNSGWKDEWVLILLSIPLVLVFIPQTAPFIFQGFAVLATTPDWYRWLLMLIFTAIYGIRIWRRKD